MSISARKLDISHFGLPVVRTDGWMGVWLVDHVINKFSRIITDATPKLYPSVGEGPLTDSSMASQNVQLTTLSRASFVVSLFCVVKNNRDFLQL